ncbi:hypothetical protein N9V84_07925 [Verrucomicrobiales bacterium]|jgi:hypothetical protein|nr:hypothetical protein [Verrucomicrobiales bacterium]
MLTPIEDLDFSHGSEEDDGEWSARLYGPGYNFEGDWPHGDYVLNVNKYIRDGSPWYNMSWNADYEGKACCSKAALVHPRIMKDFVGWVGDRGIIIQVQRLVLPLAMTN